LYFCVWKLLIVLWTTWIFFNWTCIMLLPLIWFTCFVSPLHYCWELSHLQFLWLALLSFRKVWSYHIYGKFDICKNFLVLNWRLTTVMYAPSCKSWCVNIYFNYLCLDRPIKLLKSVYFWRVA
jgi:hypothetical protein